MDGSGAGKSACYIKPNILQCLGSYVITDPKGELYRETSGYLKANGYEVRAFNLVNPEYSDRYNPLAHIIDHQSVDVIAHTIVMGTKKEGAASSDPFWDETAKMLLKAAIYYVISVLPEEEQNFAVVGEMLRAGKPKEDDEDYESPLDILFKKLEYRNPDHIAVKYYKDYHSGAGRTLKSIQVTLSSKLEKFNLDEIANLTMTDEMELDRLGEEKIAVFAVIPDTYTSYNFLVSILYTQIFQNAFYRADNNYRGALPVPIHFLMDEFANVALPDDFDKILSVMRSRNVFVSIILQNISQLKALFEKQWESIVRKL